MNEAQKMAVAIRQIMTFNRDGLVDALMCLAAAAPSAFLTEIAERTNKPELKPNPETTATSLLTEVVVPGGELYGKGRYTFTQMEMDEIRKVYGTDMRDPKRISAIKRIREIKGTGLAESKVILEEMERRGLLGR